MNSTKILTRVNHSDKFFLMKHEITFKKTILYQFLVYGCQQYGIKQRSVTLLAMILKFDDIPSSNELKCKICRNFE